MSITISNRRRTINVCRLWLHFVSFNVAINTPCSNQHDSFATAMMVPAERRRQFAGTLPSSSSSSHLRLRRRQGVARGNKNITRLSQSGWQSSSGQEGQTPPQRRPRRLVVYNIDNDIDFAKELEKSTFEIFEPIMDLGFFSWRPNVGTPIQPFADDNRQYLDIGSIESPTAVTARIDLDGMPHKLVNLKRLQVPKRFRSGLPSNKYVNKFPYGQIEIACIYVAAKHRGLDLTDVDFVFGGSTLDLLASQTAVRENDDKLMSMERHTPYFATRIPCGSGDGGSRQGPILVCKQKEYVQDVCHECLQFERYVTGQDITGGIGDELLDFVEHIHLMKVGPYKVLFHSEIDAMITNNKNGRTSLVEVKMSNIIFQKTRGLFQMISSGSSALCLGERGYGGRNKMNRVMSIDLKSLSDVARATLDRPKRKRGSGTDVTMLERNIIHGMKVLKSEFSDEVKGDGVNDDHHDGGNQIRRIYFEDRRLKLDPVDEEVSLLPPKNIIESLLL